MFENITNLALAGIDRTGQYSSGDRQVISITDLISEGPVYGLVNSLSSIYLNDDRVAPFSQSGNSFSATAAKVQLTLGSDEATIINSGSTTPVLASTNGDKYLIVRGVHKINVTATGGSRSESNGNVTATLTTAGSANFFTADMVSSGSADLGTLVPARLTVVGGNESGSIVEGTIIGTSTQSVASFMPGAGSPQGVIVPDGEYFLQIDRIVKIGSILLNVLTLAANWPFTTTGTQSYSFDVSSAIVSNADVISQTEIKKYKSVTTQFRVGTLDQPPFIGYGGTGSTSITHSPGLVLERSTTYGGQQAPRELVGSSPTSGFNLSTAQIQEVDEVTITISYANGLYAVTDKGNDRTTYAQYKISLALKRPGASGYESYITLHNPFQHAALEKNAISFITRIDLDQYRPFSDFKVKVERISDQSGAGYKYPGVRKNSYNNISTAAISSVTSVLKSVLTHPFTSMAKVTFDSKQFQSLPTRSYHLKGLKVLVPSNYVTRDQNSSGVANYNRNISTGDIETTYQDWDGSFAVDKVYTNNPAWIFYDILTNNRYGLGDFLSQSDIDKYSLYRIARYCDELVPDGKGGQEPRFTANLYLTKSADAYKVLKDIATVFRSMIYFFDGQITPVLDAPSGPVYNFTGANVLNGSFSYESTGSKTRINQVIVTWVNPDSNYKAEPLIVEDKLNIAQTGKIISQTAVAMGATSEGQAMRYGRWKLWTAANQREVVTFSTSLNGAFLSPGDIINIQDPNRFAIRLGGRVSNTGSRTDSVIPLDTPTTLNGGSEYTLSVLFTEPGAFATSQVTIDGKNYEAGDLITHAYIDGAGDGGSTGNGTYTLQAIDTEQKSQNAKASANSSDSLILTWTESTKVETKEVSNPGSSTVSSLAIKTTGTDANGNANTAFSSVPEADSIWVLTETINSVDIASSSKQYKILAISESSKNEVAISAVEYYDEKFNAVDTDFTTYIADTVYPTVISEDTVPPPLDVFSTTLPKKEQIGESLLLSWVAPSNVGDFPGDYEHLFGFEITHDFPGLENPIRISDSKQRTWKLDGVEEGSYTVAVRTINVLNNLSDPVRIRVTITDRFDESIPRIAAGLPIGGTCSTTSSLSSSGIFSLSNNIYGFRPPQSLGAFLSNTSTNTNTYQLDTSGLPQITWTAQQESGDFILEHHYIVMQANESTNVMRLIKYKNDASHNVPYWFDAGTGSETTGTTSLTGTLQASSNTKVIGNNNTLFTTELSVGSLLLVNSEAALVSSIESNTVLYIDRPIGIAAGDSASTNNYHFDYTNHTVIARVYKTSSGYNMVSFISLDTELSNSLSGNLLRNAAFKGLPHEDGSTGAGDPWDGSTNPAPLFFNTSSDSWPGNWGTNLNKANVEMGVQNQLGTVTNMNENTFYMTDGNGSATSAANNIWSSGYAPVEGGSTYEAFCWTAVGSATATVSIAFFGFAPDPNNQSVEIWTNLGGGTLVSGSQIQNANEYSGADKKLSDYKLTSCVRVAPSNAEMARFQATKGATYAGPSSSYMFVALPFLGKVSANTKIASGNWSGGETTPEWDNLPNRPADADVLNNSINVSLVADYPTINWFSGDGGLTWGPSTADQVTTVQAISNGATSCTVTWSKGTAGDYNKVSAAVISGSGFTLSSFGSAATSKTLTVTHTASGETIDLTANVLITDVTGSGGK